MAKFNLYVLLYNCVVTGKRGTLLVALLVEALHCNPEGRGFDPRWCHWNFSLTQPFRTMALGLTQPLTEMRVKAAGT